MCSFRIATVAKMFEVVPSRALAEMSEKWRFGECLRLGVVQQMNANITTFARITAVKSRWYARKILYLSVRRNFDGFLGGRLILQDMRSCDCRKGERDGRLC